MKKEKLLIIILMLLVVFFLLGCVESSDKINNDVDNGDGDAPDFTLDTLDGRTIKLSDYFGKVVLLDFMGVDCQYCRYLMDELVHISNVYSESDIEIISIDIYSYETEEYLQSYIDWYAENNEGELDWTFGKDKTGEIASDYVPGGGVPKINIIDQNGNIYYTKVGYTEFSVLAEQLDKLL